MEGLCRQGPGQGLELEAMLEDARGPSAIPRVPAGGGEGGQGGEQV